MSIPLPAAAESPRCSDFTRAHSLDPGGTALSPDVVVLAEVPEPWPKPAGKHESMTALVKAAQARPEALRLLAAVPVTDGSRRLVAFRRTDGGLVRSEVAISDDPVADLDAVLSTAGSRPVALGSPERTVLICTQGSHDVCCGTDGLRLAEWAGAHLDAVEIFRVSHTGGHRFAPTAMTLPDGRMWAHLSAERLEAILARSLPVADAVSICRGWWGARSAPEQIAERAVFAQLGWAVDRSARHVTAQNRDGGGVQVDVELADQRWVVHVRPGRELPTIACSSPGGLPVKVSREWNVEAVHRIGSPPAAPSTV